MAISDTVLEDIEFPSRTVCDLSLLANTNTQPQRLVYAFDAICNILNKLESSEEYVWYMYGEVLTPTNWFDNLGLDGGVRARDFMMSAGWKPTAGWI